MKSRLFSLALAAAAVAIASGCAAPTTSSAPAAKAPTSAAPVAKWTCTAPGLVTANYNGGNMAYVHLARYTSGGNYMVVKDPSGKKATGKTADGTTFVCATTA